MSDLIDHARRQSESGDKTVALLRHTHVTRALSAACEDFPLRHGEWAVVTAKDGDVAECTVHDSLVDAEAGYESRR